MYCIWLTQRFFDMTIINEAIWLALLSVIFRLVSANKKFSFHPKSLQSQLLQFNGWSELLSHGHFLQNKNEDNRKGNLIPIFHPLFPNWEWVSLVNGFIFHILRFSKGLSYFRGRRMESWNIAVAQQNNHNYLSKLLKHFRAFAWLGFEHNSWKFCLLVHKM